MRLGQSRLDDCQPMVEDELRYGTFEACRHRRFSGLGTVFRPDISSTSEWAFRAISCTGMKSVTILSLECPFWREHCIEF